MNWSIATRSGSIPLDRSTPTPLGAPPPTYDAATEAWVTAVGSGNVTTGRKDLLDALIVGLKADSIWSKLDRLWLYAAENTNSALVDIKGLATTTAVNSPTFTVDRGYNGDGSTSYLNTNFNPTTATTPNYVAASCHWGHWNNTNSIADQVYCGLVNTGTSFQAFSSVFYQRIGDNGAGMSTNNPLGFQMATRTTGASRDHYRNGGFLQNIVVAGGAVGNFNFLVLWASGAGAKSSTQCAAFSIGGGFNSTEAAAYYTRLRTYFTAIGVP